MVLEEAKILDKFTIITNTASREVVENYNKSIILENNENDIYEGMKKIIENNKELLKKANNNENYSNQNIIEEIKKLLDETN